MIANYNKKGAFGLISKLVLSVALYGTLFLTNCARALYEKDMGRNDWRVETLGELTDMIFIGENQAYTLSSDALLTLFDTSTQTIQWKKQLPVNADQPESYQLRHLGRNLLVQSNERVLMVNSVGHVIFEQPLTGVGLSKIDIFTHQSKVHSVFARGNSVTIYLQHQEIGTLELPQFTDIAEKFDSINPEPVEIIYRPETQQLLVISKVALSEAKNQVQVATYEVKLDSLEIELRSHAIVPKFTHSDRTSKFIIIYTDETLTSAQAYNPEDFSRLVANISQISSKPSKNDDLIFVQSSSDNSINYYNLSNRSESGVTTTVKDAKSSKEC